MRRLLGQDAAFWYAETAGWHMHVGSVGILDPADAPDFSFERVRDVIIERLPLIPQFRWKVKEMPLHLDRPVWVEEDEFDIDYHIRRVGVPSPGGQQELEDLVGHLMSYPLNRSVPLWEMWFIDGLAGGKVAMLTKVHHAVIDGVSGAGLGEILFDITPEPRETPPVDPTAFADVVAPNTPEMIAQILVNSAIVSPWRIAKLLRQSLRGVIAPPKKPSGGRPPRPILDAPRVPFCGEITPHRSYSAASVPLERIKMIKDAAGVKVNDVVLAVCAGVLRGYLEDLDAMPKESLVAQVPVSLRTAADQLEVGNKIGTMFIKLATDIDDPAERIKAIYAGSQSAKEMRQAMEARNIIGITEAMPPALIGLAARAASSTSLQFGTTTPPPVNVIISNVPGPAFPLYCAGALIESLIPLGPPLLGIGLNITVFSYIDKVEFGYHTCRELMPDVASVAARTDHAVGEIEAALGVGAAKPKHRRRKAAATA